jgi:hypothetical protein
MRTTFLVLSFISSISLQAMEMQHGFILKGKNGEFASHLVATGHHSRQVDVEGMLEIPDDKERALYELRKKENYPARSYFLFQAQNMDLANIPEGIVSAKYYSYNGHIVECPIGDYTPKNVIVKQAFYSFTNVLLNIVNPFFGDQ